MMDYPPSPVTAAKLTLLCCAALLAACAGLRAEPEQTENATPAEENTVPEETNAITAMQANIETLKAAGKINTSDPSWREHLPKFPSVTFSDGTGYYWNLKTNKGNIKLKFMPDVAPHHVANFIYLTELGFFDGLNFHRVIPGFMAQGGCPKGTGTGGPGYQFAGEFSATVRHDKPGILSMANRGPNTDGCQFFITFVPTPHLNGKHTVFGEVVEGMDTLNTLAKYGSSPTGRTSERLFIEEATVGTE
jgi:cyclophilin family peptidyl-prolyl cis-trans isomerase